MIAKMRTGTFETNSSSVHSLTMVSPEAWEQIKMGGYLARSSCSGRLETGRVYSYQELSDMGFDEEEIESKVEWYDLLCLDTIQNYDGGLEWDINEVVTPGGENVVILCQHGNDY